MLEVFLFAGREQKASIGFSFSPFSRSGLKTAISGLPFADRSGLCGGFDLSSGSCHLASR